MKFCDLALAGPVIMPHHVVTVDNDTVTTMVRPIGDEEEDFT